MKPYLIDKVQNHAGDEVDTTEPEAYKRLMTDNEASLLGELMKGVVQNGTASSLNGRGYTVAGKTGSAEYNESGASHSWFVGYSNVDNPDTRGCCHRRGWWYRKRGGSADRSGCL